MDKTNILGIGISRQVTLQLFIYDVPSMANVSNGKTSTAQIMNEWKELIPRNEVDSIRFQHSAVRTLGHFSDETNRRVCDENTRIF